MVNLARSGVVKCAFDNGGTVKLPRRAEITPPDTSICDRRQDFSSKYLGLRNKLLPASFIERAEVGGSVLAGDDQQKYRQAASECVKQARASSNAGTRLGLLKLARRWLDLAERRSNARGQYPDDAAAPQMSQTQATSPSQPVGQQQQKIQPKSNDPEVK